jgi:trk system potassium uptake protein TrkH
VFGKFIGEDSIFKSLSIMFLTIAMIAASSLALSSLEVGAADSSKRVFLNTFFEVVSAYGTVGLSVGDGGVLSYCAKWSDAGKMVLALSMLAGRVGILSFIVAISRNTPQRRVKYPEARLRI